MPTRPLSSYKVIIPYSESAHPKKRFKIEYSIEAPDRSAALAKAEREFFSYTMYNSASWVRVIEREAMRAWKILPERPQTPQLIDEFAARLDSDDLDVTYNTLRVLGELEDASAAPRVLPLLQHADADVVSLAAETLGKLGDATNLPFLLGIYAKEAHPKVKACVLSAISRLARPEDNVQEILASALGDGDARVRANAVEVVERLKIPATTRILLPLLEDEDNRVRANVLKALWDTHDRRAMTKVLTDMAFHENRWMRASAAFVLQHLEVEDRRALLETLARDTFAEVHAHARRAIFKIADLAFLPLWLEHVQTDEHIEYVAHIVEKASFDALAPLLAYQPRNDQEKRHLRFFLDRLEQRIFQDKGWLSWLKLKRQRIFPSLR